MERNHSDWASFQTGDRHHRNQQTHGETTTQGELLDSHGTERPKPTHYEILNIEPHATRLEIREAYLRLKSAYDSGSAALYSLIPDEEARVLLHEMETAFQVLSDDVTRRSYDITLGLGGSGPLSASAGLGFESHRASPPPHADRLIYAQESLRAERLSSFGAHAPERSDYYGNSPEINSLGRDMAATSVQTSRSQLPVVKLKAEKCDDRSLGDQMLQLLEGADLADGELYKKLRELAGVSQDEMQDRTKISVGYLLALESNRLDRLPQAVYVKGFLRSYFRYIGAPHAEKMVEAFAAKLTQWQAQNRA